MQDNTWKDIIAKLTKDFMDWGCPYSRKKLPEIASGYECTPLQFWNWLDDPETPRTEKGFLRVIVYAWRKYLEAEAEQEEKGTDAPPKTAPREEVLPGQETAGTDAKEQAPEAVLDKQE